MTRDLDLIRGILIEVEKRPYTKSPFNISVPGYSEVEIGYHVMLLDQAGLIAAECITAIDETDAAGWKPVTLTWEGHEFLEAAKNPGHWDKAKTIISQKGGGMVLDVLKATLIEIAKRAALAAIT
jgi:hypothetical protein